jgi:acetyltransferase-like isoleucine patch superfamily enzyme
VDDDIEKLVVFGCGAMALELCTYIDAVASTWKLTGKTLIVTDVVSSEFSRVSQLEQILGYSVARHDDVERVENFHLKKCVIGIGSAEAVRRVSEAVDTRGGNYFSVIHPSAIVSDHAEVHDGVIISPFCFVAPFSCVGRNSILNVRSTVGHDAVVGQGCVISPHVNINGGARIGRFCFLGAGVVIDPRVRLGDFCKVASGLTIRKDVQPGHMAFEGHTKTVRMFDSSTGASLFRKD